MIIVIACLVVLVAQICVVIYNSPRMEQRRLLKALARMEAAAARAEQEEQ